MNVLFIDWPCFDREETKEALANMGHQVFTFFHEDYNSLYSESFDSEIKQSIEKNNIELVFSYNYYPLIALACKDESIYYMSFLYDNPYAYIYSYTLMFQTNIVFLFDSSLVEYFQKGGLKNVFYMNLPGAPDKIEKLLKEDYGKSRYLADVSFVGALYNEAHNFYDRIDWSKNPYAKGFVQGLMDAQKKVSGYNFIEECLTPKVLEQLQSLFPLEKDKNSIETDGFRFADYVINRKLTSRERMDYLSGIGQRFGKDYSIKLFTLDENVEFPGVSNMGIATYETEMPRVFYHSKINLNISLRSIKTGIPLRCMDIMAAHGFLLSNYQSDFFIDFVPGEDFAYYENEEDLYEKIEYFLTHEKERMEIAENGFQKVLHFFTVEDVLKRMFEVGLSKPLGGETC
ncbi:MAG: DUF3880 domain-containing protein [Lachnospiraceae bacterium]|nr:DUF3880 domain-containing protein [Lachnospiraceae bacterium]